MLLSQLHPGLTIIFIADKNYTIGFLEQDRWLHTELPAYQATGQITTTSCQMQS